MAEGDDLADRRGVHPFQGMQMVPRELEGRQQCKQESVGVVEQREGRV
jgi:hypothetical protein